MIEKNKFELNYKEIIKGLIFTLIILLPIVIYGYVAGSPKETIWPAVVVTQIGVALIWLIIRLGVFSTSSRGIRRIGNSVRDRKRNKLGAYNSEQKKKANTVIEIQKQNKFKSKHGIYIMLILGVIEFVSTLATYI